MIKDDELTSVHIEDYEIRQDSSIKEMLDIIYKNVKYPPICRSCSFEGTVVISFIIEKDGTTSNHKIIRNPGCGTGDEALRVTKLLPNFTPGTVNRKPVRVQFNLPIRFRLD